MSFSLESILALLALVTLMVLVIIARRNYAVILGVVLWGLIRNA